MPAPGSYRFGPYRLDRAAYRLVDGDRSIELSPKALDLLLLLVEHAGSLVTKDEILKAVWPDVAVTDNALTQVVSDLRHALGDSSSAPRYLETVPRRGYRFIAPVETVTAGLGAGHAGESRRRAQEHRGARFHERHRRGRSCVACGRHRGDRHERSPRDPRSSRDRSVARRAGQTRCRGRAPAIGRSGLRRHRQLPAIG